MIYLFIFSIINISYCKSDCCGATVACLAKKTGNKETDICRKADDNWFDKGLAAMYNGFASVKCIGS